MSDRTCVRIRNFEKFNPRKGVKKRHWVRVDRNITVSESLFGLLPDAKWTWIVLLCEADDEGVVYRNSRYLADKCGVTEDEFDVLIVDFQDRGLLETFLHPSESDTDLHRSAQICSEEVSDENRFTQIGSNLCPTGQDRTNKTRQDEQDKTERKSSETTLPRPYDLALIWNETKNADMPGVKLDFFKPKSSRWTTAAARLRDFPDLDQWRDVIRRVCGSPFHSGKNDRGWVATFDFLVRPDTYAKAMEGQFDQREAYDPDAPKPLSADFFEKYGSVDDAR